MKTSKRPLGFKTTQGPVVHMSDHSAMTEPVGRLATHHAPPNLALGKTSVVCPICSDPLFTVPGWIVMGRIVAVEDNVAAVDPLPEGIVPLYCLTCRVTFYGRE